MHKTLQAVTADSCNLSDLSPVLCDPLLTWSPLVKGNHSSHPATDSYCSYHMTNPQKTAGWLPANCRRKHVSKATDGLFRNMAKKPARMVRLLREFRKLWAHFVGSASAMKSLICGSSAGLGFTRPCTETESQAGNCFRQLLQTSVSQSHSLLRVIDLIPVINR